MLSKKKRLNRANFNKILEKSRRVENNLFSLRARFVDKKESFRASVVVSSKVAKKAVVRNTLKRQIYDILAQNKGLSGLWAVVYVKKEAVSKEKAEIESSIKSLFKAVL